MAKDQLDTEVVHVRLPKTLVKGVDHVAVDEDLYRQDVIAQMLAAALAQYHQLGRMPGVVA